MAIAKNTHLSNVNKTILLTGISLRVTEDWLIKLFDR